MSPTPINIRNVLERLIAVARGTSDTSDDAAAAAAEGSMAIQTLEHLLDTADKAADALGELAAGGLTPAVKAKQLYMAIAAARGLS
ncbi:hypothetical protein LDO11_08515 [Luteimonas sp. MHLX1A]|nr:hypothetical protein [Luteimonas sp. MHLX1A]